MQDIHRVKKKILIYLKFKSEWPVFFPPEFGSSTLKVQYRPTSSDCSHLADVGQLALFTKVGGAGMEEQSAGRWGALESPVTGDSLQAPGDRAF